MIWIMKKTDKSILTGVNSISLANKYIEKNKLNPAEYSILKEIDAVEYVSRITHVDGKCIYNNANYWIKHGYDIIGKFNDHEVLDILGQPVSLSRYKNELYTNINRLSAIDGRPGQIKYNIDVGNEFISLFREECILTNFTNKSNTSPMIIFKKLESVIAMTQVGAFREAKQTLAAYREQIKDDFLTDERIDKYIDMLTVADAIEYATDENYFYIVPENVTVVSAE